MPHQLVWVIFLLPFFSFAVNALVIRPFLSHRHRLSGYVTIGAIGGSLALSLWALWTVLGRTDHNLPVPDVSWVVIENGVNINLGLIMDSLSAVMLVVVLVVSLMVQVYSQGYMHVITGDRDYSAQGYVRYFAFMSLFTGFMLGLILADSLLFLYVFWEGVGLSSYLLIGFWFHRPAAANAAKKAFIVTRIGDFGLLLAILYLYLKVGTVDILELHALAAAGALTGVVLTWAAVGIFAGAVGKSAQFPLHTWLPDAMEGPTPVSALIHAATMVAAGVFLVARMFPLFEHSPQALTTVAVIGGFTAIFAATMGLVMHDIKRVIAYSTISQLGYMMLGLGSGGMAIGIFHLFNHAFFKALLFLGAGSVNHATGTFDMRRMGGLKKVMPWTYGTFLLASLSLAGIWPLAGFWSKDELLAQVYEEQRLLFYLGMATVFLTAFYIFRVFFLTFGGKYRGEKAKLHESPAVMVAPMVVLAVLAVTSGWLNLTGGFDRFLGGHGEAHGLMTGLFGILAHPLPLVSLALAGLGIGLAYAMYGSKVISAETMGRTFAPLYTLFSRKYWMDELYEKVFVNGVLVNGLFRVLDAYDSGAIDGMVNSVAGGTLGLGRGVRRLQTGQLQIYALAIVAGLVLIMAGLYYFNGS